MTQMDEDDITQVLTALADLTGGYAERELSSGWREAAGRIAEALRSKGHDDEGTWDKFVEAIAFSSR
jgi:hypothetical protein